MGNDTFGERNKRQKEEEEKLIIKPIPVTNEEKLDISEGVEDENEDIEKEAKKKFSDVFEERKKIKSNDDEKIIIKPKVGISTQNQEKDGEESDESEEEEDEDKQSKIETKKKLSINDLRSSMKVKLNIQQENNIPKRKKKDNSSDDIKDELTFDDFPEISKPTNEPKKKKIADEFHEKVKIEQVQDDKLIIRTLPELITDNEREMNLENEDPKNNKRINDTFGERNKRQKDEEEKLIIKPIPVTIEEKSNVSEGVEHENEIIEKEAKKKVSDVFDERKKIKSNDDEKIMIKPKVGISTQNQEKDNEESSETEEEEDEEKQSKIKTKKKLSINDLRSSMKVKLNIQQENNIPKRKKKDNSSDDIKDELTFDDFPEISDPINELKKKKISDEFHEKVKIEQVQDEKLIIRTLPELMTDNEREMNLE